MDFYLLILNNQESGERLRILGRARSLGEVRQVLNEVFILSHQGAIMDASAIRDLLCGEEKYMLMVIRLDDEFKSAWSMTSENSNYMKSVFNQIYGENRQ